MVRSIEQQYWALSQQQVAPLEPRGPPSGSARRSSSASEAELAVGAGNTADIAEAEQQLEKFRLNLVTATSDVITTERQLRNILGLPPADNRRIVPATPPAEAKARARLGAASAQMLESQPDIAQQRALVRLAEIQLLLARNQLLPYLKLNDLYQINGLGRLGDRGR